MSTLQVENLIGPTSGSNANKVIIPSGQTLDASNGFVAPAGSVIQVIHNGTTTQVNNGSQTFIDSNLQAGITPQFATSKILVLINQNVHKYGAYIDQMQLRITRDNTPILTWATEVLHDNGALTHFDIFASQTYLDSPSTTSEVTYRTQFRRRLTTSASMQVQYAGSRSSITVMEIAQ